jgi:hypothetical protein
MIPTLPHLLHDLSNVPWRSIDPTLWSSRLIATGGRFATTLSCWAARTSEERALTAIPTQIDQPASNGLNPTWIGMCDAAKIADSIPGWARSAAMRRKSPKLPDCETRTRRRGRSKGSYGRSRHRNEIPEAERAVLRGSLDGLPSDPTLRDGAAKQLTLCPW